MPYLFPAIYCCSDAKISAKIGRIRVNSDVSEITTLILFGVAATMEVDKLLSQLHKVCVNHFDELCQDGTERIRVLSVELDSHTIWGGNGDSDTDITFFITRKGWVSQEITTEFGLYQKGAGIVKDVQQEIAEVNMCRVLTQRPQPMISSVFKLFMSRYVANIQMNLNSPDRFI